MNIYQFTRTCECLVDGKTIRYEIEIKTHEAIFAEDLIGFKIKQPNIQEHIADQVYSRFGGEQTIVGIHSGVRITTLRG